MSKLEKQQQQYTEKPIFPTCGTCVHFTSEKVLPAWMQRENAEGRQRLHGGAYTPEEDGVEKNFRCKLGGFAVKKLATCAKQVSRK